MCTHNVFFSFCFVKVAPEVLSGVKTAPACQATNSATLSSPAAIRATSHQAAARRRAALHFAHLGVQTASAGLQLLSVLARTAAVTIRMRPLAKFAVSINGVPHQ